MTSTPPLISKQCKRESPSSRPFRHRGSSWSRRISWWNHTPSPWRAGCCRGKQKTPVAYKITKQEGLQENKKNQINQSNYCRFFFDFGTFIYNKSNTTRQIDLEGSSRDEGRIKRMFKQTGSGRYLSAVYPSSHRLTSAYRCLRAYSYWKHRDRGKSPITIWDHQGFLITRRDTFLCGSWNVEHFHRKENFVVAEHMTEQESTKTTCWVWALVYSQQQKTGGKKKKTRLLYFLKKSRCVMRTNSWQNNYFNAAFLKLLLRETYFTSLFSFNTKLLVILKVGVEDVTVCWGKKKLLICRQAWAGYMEKSRFQNHSNIPS